MILISANIAFYPSYPSLPMYYTLSANLFFYKNVKHFSCPQLPSYFFSCYIYISIIKVIFISSDFTMRSKQLIFCTTFREDFILGQET